MKYVVMILAIFSWALTGLSFGMFFATLDPWAFIWSMVTLVFTMFTTFNTLNIWTNP